jgi:hypothetical protein
LREKVRDDTLERFLFAQMQRRENKFYMSEEPQHQTFAMHGKGKGSKGHVQNANSNLQGQAPQTLSNLMNQANGGHGKGKGKGKGKGQPMDTKPPQFKAKIVCKFCKKNWAL